MSEMFHAPCLSSTGAVRHRYRTDKGYGLRSSGFRGEGPHAMGALVGLVDEPTCIRETCVKAVIHVFLREFREWQKWNQPVIRDQTVWTPAARRHIRLLSHLQKHLTEQIFLFLAKSGHRPLKCLAQDNSGRGCGCWWSCHVWMDEEMRMDPRFFSQMESGKDFSSVKKGVAAFFMDCRYIFWWLSFWCNISLDVNTLQSKYDQITLSEFQFCFRFLRNKCT